MVGEGGAIGQTLSRVAAAQVDLLPLGLLPGGWLLSKTVRSSAPAVPGKPSITERWPLAASAWAANLPSSRPVPLCQTDGSLLGGLYRLTHT